MFFNISDVRMKTEEKIPKGDIPVFDMSGFTLKHLWKLIFSLSLFKKYMKFTQVGITLIKSSIFMVDSKVLMLMKITRCVKKSNTYNVFEYPKFIKFSFRLTQNLQIDFVLVNNFYRVHKTCRIGQVENPNSVQFI